jgi:hypothetical protein
MYSLAFLLVELQNPSDVLDGVRCLFRCQRNGANAFFQSAVTGKPQTGDNVTIGPRAYNSETQSFDRPWPFGPKSGPQ